MADPTDESAAKSRKIKDQAMKILRETRAKIDPQLLSAMKERFSSFVPGADPNMPLSSKPVETPPAAKPAMPKTSPKSAAALYSQMAQVAVPPLKAEDNKMEPVDRQKVAQIVMEYMKLRQDSKTKH